MTEGDFISLADTHKQTADKHTETSKHGESKTEKEARDIKIDTTNKKEGQTNKEKEGQHMRRVEQTPPTETVESKWERGGERESERARE